VAYTAQVLEAAIVKYVSTWKQNSQTWQHVSKQKK